MQKVRSKPNTLASQAKKIKPIINRITKNALIYQQISQINIEEMKQTNHNHQTFDVIKTYNIINQIENKYPVNGNFQLFDQDIIISAYQNKVTNTRFLIYSLKPAKIKYQKCLKTIKQRGYFFNQCDIIEQDTHMMIMMMHIKYTNQQTFLIKDDFFGLLQQVENILNILRQSEIENQLEKANQKQEQRLVPSAKINICYLQQFFSSNSGKIVKKQKSYLLICQFMFSQYLRTYHLSDHEELEQKQLKREVCLKLNFIDSSNTFQNIFLPNLSKLKLQSIKQVSLDAYSYQQDLYYILERIRRTQNKYQYRLQYNINSFIGQKMNNNKNQKISLIFENSSLNQSKQQSQTQKYEQQQIQIGDLIFEQIQSDLLSLNQISLLQNSIKLKYRERKIILPQAQRNRLLNLIKKQKLSQLQKHLIKIVQKQYFMVELSIQQLKCQTNNKLSQQNNNEGFQQNKNKNQTNEIQVSYEDTQLSKQNYQANYNNKKMNINNNKQLPNNLIQNDFLTQFEDRIQRMSRKQSQIFYYFPSGYYKSNINNFSGEIRQTAQQIFEGDTNYFKILLQKQKLLGGGPNSSKDKQLCSEDVQKEIQQLQQDNFFESFLDVDYKEFEDFNDGYTKYYTNDEVNEQVLENRIRKIIQVLHDECEHIFIVKIRDKVIDLINLMISYFVIILQKKKGQSIQVLIDGIDKQLKELRDTCKQNVKVYPCLDIYQYFGFLISLNSCRLGLDITNQTKIESLGKKLLSLIKFGAAFTSIYGAINNLQYITADNIKKTIKEITQICSQIAQPSQQIAQTEMESYTSYIQGNFLKNLTAILFRKINELGEEFLDPYKLIIFYVKEINYIQNQGSEDIILFAYLQLSCLLKKEQETDKLNYFSKNLKKDEKDLIFNFIQQLQLKKFSNSLLENVKKVGDLIVTNEQFRFIKIQLLLYFSQVLQNIKNKQQSEQIMIYLYVNYIQEKEISVKNAYQGSELMKQFIQNINKHYVQIIVESKNFSQQLLEVVKDENQINKVLHKILKKKDIPKLLALNYIEVWETSVKKRQNQNKIAHKDDVLLEIMDLYIQQKITYQLGNQLSDGVNSKEFDDALDIIIHQFLIPNFKSSDDNLPLKQKASNQKYQCQILSILAEGGSGKSMLLKKLEIELLKSDSKYIFDERGKYIPFTIKCSSLDVENPSIENYLLSQKLSQIEIKLLKMSQRNKLIILDGYDEYAGDYFKVYMVLKLNEWVNTLVIVASRLEKISFSDAKIYFGYYDADGKQGPDDSFAIYKLEKIKDCDIILYLERYKEKQLTESAQNFNLEHYDKCKQIILSNSKIMELLQLPINLYLTTRMVADFDLNDKDALASFQSASNQIIIQELFFSQQFRKLSYNFVEHKFNQPENINKGEQDIVKEKLIKIIQSCYFEYFQSIAIHMFLQKGKKKNFLCTTKCSIKFKLRNDAEKHLIDNCIKIEEVIDILDNYVDSRVITRTYLSQNDENHSYQSNQIIQYSQILEFEFRHKSLFEYFAARAMKYDFDIYKEEIFQMDIQQLSQFNINQRIIMTTEQNASEQQILLKFFQMIKPQINSPQFRANYINEEISQTNRYIQFLKKSYIISNTQKSQIDVGSSNLLSALFISKFSFPYLKFKNCSFSKAHICRESKKFVEFQNCNFENAFLEQQNFEYFDTSNTKNVQVSNLQKCFDTSDLQFNQALFLKNNVVAISNNGSISLYEHKVYPSNKLKSNKITNVPLKNIQIVSQNNLIIVSTLKSIYEIDSETFDVINSYKFTNHIANFSFNNSNQKYVVTFNNNLVYTGDIKNGFKMLDPNIIQSVKTLYIDNLFISSHHSLVSIYYSSKLKLIQQLLLSLEIELEVCCISQNGKYLATGVGSNCKIYSIQIKGLTLIMTIQNSVVIKHVAFSTDGQFIAMAGGTEQINNCKIWNIQSEPKLINTIDNKSNFDLINLSFSEDGNYLAGCRENSLCVIWDIQRECEIDYYIQGYKKKVFSIAFSSDSNYLFASFGSYFQIWNLKEGYKTEKVYFMDITQFSLSADCKFLVTYSDLFCKIWNLQNGELTQIEGGKFTTFSLDNKYHATGCYYGTCKIWDVQKGFQLYKTITDYKQCSIPLSFSFEYLAMSSEQENIKIFNVKKEFQLINTIKGKLIRSLVLSPNNKYLAACFDEDFHIWNVQKGFQLLNVIERCSFSYLKSGYSLCFSSNGNYLATSDSDNSFKIWNLEKGFEFVSKIQDHKKKFVLAFSPNSKYLATGSKDKTCKIWNLENRFESLNKTKQIYQSNYFNDEINFSLDARYLAVGQKCGNFKVWKIEDTLELIFYHQMGNTFTQIVQQEFSPNGKYLASVFLHECKIWEIENGLLIKTIKLEIYRDYDSQIASFSVDNKYLATIQDGNCNIWDAQKEFEHVFVTEGLNSKIISVAFSADGNYLATSLSDHSCKIWDINQEFLQINTIYKHQNVIKQLVFSPDSKYLVTISELEIFIWNTKKQFELIKQIEQIYINYKPSISFTADSKYLATRHCNRMETIHIWNVEEGFKLIYIILDDNGKIKKLAFSSNGKYLATIYHKNITCKVWNIETGLDMMSKKQISKNELGQFLFQTVQIDDIFEQIYEIF